MRRRLLITCACGILFILSLAALDWHSAGQRGGFTRADDAASKAATPVPVEDSMHEFMEYVFQPAYKRLREQMAAEPADNVGWKAIKSDSLILAEGGNLLLLRVPEDKGDEWAAHSQAVRKLGGQFYDAAKKKDYAAARQKYTSMLTQCNACHTQFAEGKHQLVP
jgi:hypothetical protein